MLGLEIKFILKICPLIWFGKVLLLMIGFMKFSSNVSKLQDRLVLAYTSF